jgi:acetoacetyl-CoA synthetase
MLLKMNMLPDERPSQPQVGAPGRTPSTEGTRKPIYIPDPAVIARSELTDFTRFCADRTGFCFPDQASFHRFSSTDYRTFWRLFLDWSGLIIDGHPEPVCEGDQVERAQFFPNLRLSYAENLLAEPPEATALIARHGDGRREQLSRGELRERVFRLARALRQLGVQPGDRVACIARNNAEAVIAALTTAVVGAVFSSCGADMGAFAILSRFAPLAPVVLFANTQAEPWDTGIPLAARVAEAATGLTSLRAIVSLDDGPLPRTDTTATHRLNALIAAADGGVMWERRPLDYPLFAMFSSGTTGAPKCLLHGAGGTLLEHVKEHRLHCDLRPGERLFFQTSCGWMMWNWQLSGLASGIALVLYDGPLTAPETLWRIVAEEQVSVFGTSPAYLRFCEDAGLSPGRQFDLGALRAVLSTGSVLYPRQYDWAADHVGRIPLQSISGGTDIIGCFVLGSPNLPVHRGEAQCRSLGLDVRALPAAEDPGSPVGELVCANPFPSRPIGLWGDADGSRFHAAYFSQNPGLWTHGDLIEFTEAGGARLHGRSDGVLNIRGVRVGPAEIYAALEDLPEIVEAMAVEQSAEEEPGGTRLVLLVQLKPGATLDAALAARVRTVLLERGSAAMVPARIAAVTALPETHNGKRSEAAARDAVNSRSARNREALRNPECLDEIAAHPALRAPAPVFDPAPVEDLPMDERLEAELQALCERILEVSPIQLSDNLFTVRGDSLAILTLFMEIEQRAKCELPFAALFVDPTITGLAALLRGTGGDRTRSVHVRPAEARDKEQICVLLHQAGIEEETFDLIKPQIWRRLFDYGWLLDRPGLGFVLVDGDEIVGFLGTIYANREIDDKGGLICNLSSWYVRSQYRGWGAALLRAALRDESITYTCLTPNLLSQHVFEMLGFSELSSSLLILPPLLHVETLRHARPQISFDSKTIRVVLDDRQRCLFDDHAPYDCLQLVVQEGPEHAYIVVKRRVMPVPKLARLLPAGARMPYSEILHCSNPRLFARHLERVKLAILWRQRTALLLAETRLFSPRLRGATMGEHTYYRSPLFGAGELDKLYSELVLLPI